MIGQTVFFLISLLEYVSFLLVFFYLLYQTGVVEKLQNRKRDWLLVTIFIGLFGGLSILATIQGVRITDASGQVLAIANTRDMAPLIAGILGGPAAGVGAGLIGGIHRYFYGGATRLPCGIATVFAGLLGGLLYYRKRQEFLRPGIGFGITALYELFHMFLVWVLSDYFSNFTTFITLAVPMVLSNSIGVSLFALMIAFFRRQRNLTAMKERIDSEMKMVHSLQTSILPRVETEVGGDESAEKWHEWLIPHMTRESHKKGEVLFSKEDTADKLFYITRGVLYLKEIDKRVGKGEIIGETGILSPFHQRTVSALCETDLEAYSLPREKVIELSYQKPSLLSDLTQLSIKRVLLNLKETISEKERIESELQVAYRIQTDMLPHHFPREDDFELTATMVPAREVGGDLYDFFPIDGERYFFLIGDVSGKGVPAALFMAITKTLLKGEAMRGIKPHEVLSNVNVTLCADNDESMFVTVFCGSLNRKTGVVEFANAGHNPPVLVPDKGKPEYLSVKPGFILGGMPGVLYETQSINLASGDVLYLYTDGITEAMNQEEQLFTGDRLMDTLCRVKRREVADIQNAVQQAVEAHVQDAPQSDDITMVTLKYKAKKGA